MRSFFLPVSVLLLFCAAGCAGDEAKTKTDSGAIDSVTVPIVKSVIDTNFHNADIIFQTSNSGQSLAIQLATHSKYSHCGLVFNDNGKWMVYEAVQPVKKTPIEEWIDRGDGDHYVVRRLLRADSLLPDAVAEKVRAAAEARMGHDYDLYFNWDDERIYCSELVWKSYNDVTGLEVGERKPLKSFDLSNPIVKKKLEERYGSTVPGDVMMISPGNIFDSPLLITVKEH